MIKINFKSTSKDLIYDSQKKMCGALVTTSAYIDRQIEMPDIEFDNNVYFYSMTIGNLTTEDIQLEVDLDTTPIFRLE